MQLMFSILVTTLLAMVVTCNKEKASGTCFKGKLVRKGICMNYTISVTEGNVDTALLEASWHEPNTDNHFTKAFRLGTPCSFPSGIEEGDEFYFKIIPAADQNCVVCQAYYPTPDKSLNIKVLDGPCP
jgi:hypothetical protein